MKFFSRLIAVLSPSCKEVTRLQSEVFEHKLTFLQRAGLRFHLVLCKWCRRYGKQIRFLRLAAQRCEQDEQIVPSQVLSSEARNRMKRAIEVEKK